VVWIKGRVRWDWVFIGFELGLFGFVLPGAKIAVFFIILCGKEGCIGFCRFDIWLCFFGGQIGGLFS
jgi:hypothetical protein